MNQLSRKHIGLICLFITQAFFSCKKEKEDAVILLEKKQQYNLDIPEPSGLSFGREPNTFLIASDKVNKIFETNLKGEILDTLDYQGDDIEGITFNANIIMIVEEQSNEVIQLTKEGKIVERFGIEKPFGSGTNGLEGICYHTEKNNYFLINEENPGILYLWNPIEGVIKTIYLNFAKDYSDIFADPQNSCLWIVSDESRSLYKCDYNGKKLIEYQLDRKKYEGIVVDSKNELVYLVNDETSELAIFKLKN